MKIEKAQIFLILFGLMVGSFFQNCANHNWSLVKPPPNVVLPMDHPSTPEAESSPTADIALIDQKGIQTLLSEVFLNNGVSDSGQIEFSNFFSTYISNEQHMFGRPCDILSTGSLSNCANNFTNLSNGMSQSTSTIRAASMIQVCRSLVSQNEMMDQLILRIVGQNQNTLPNPQSLIIAIQLFYPAWDNLEPIIHALASVDSQLAKNGESMQMRWKVIVSTLCESPYWGLL